MSEINPWLPVKNNGQSFLDPFEFRRVVLAHAQPCLWEKASRCPCTVKGRLTAASDTGATGQAQSDCKACFGFGYIYHAPQEITVMFHSAADDKKAREIYGEQTTGMGLGTFLPEYQVRPLDRITMTRAVIPVSEVRTRHGDVERLRYPIVLAPVVTDGSDGRQEYWSNLYVIRTDERGAASPVPLVEGQDYERTAAGELRWLSGAGVQSEGVFEGAGLVAGTMVPEGTPVMYGQAYGRTVGVAYVSSYGRLSVLVRADVAGVAGDAAGPLVCMVLAGALQGRELTSQGGMTGGVDGRVPAVGERYSIDYMAMPTYIVDNAPHFHRVHPVSTKVALKMGDKYAVFPTQFRMWLEMMGRPHGPHNYL